MNKVWLNLKQFSVRVAVTVCVSSELIVIKPKLVLIHYFM